MILEAEMKKSDAILFHLCLTLYTFVYVQTVQITLQEIRDLGAFCPNNLDNCQIPSRSAYKKEKTCECDNKCAFFDDCCVDSQYRPEKATPRPENVKCLQVGWYVSVFAIDKCKPGWSNEKIRKLCEENTYYDIPLDGTPVTDPNSEITYVNQYCAICNNIPLNSTFYWQVGTTAERLRDDYPNITAQEIIDSLQVDKNDGVSVLKYNPRTEKEESYYIGVTYFFPSYKADKVRFCWKNLISDCSPEWEDDIFREKCRNYVGALFFYKLGYDQYRNIHCAVCNNVTFSPGDYKCEQTPTHVKLTSSFMVLMDFNFIEGKNVGEKKSECKEDEAFDTFAKKCRKVVCGLEDYIMIEGKCKRV